jgi:hypothetical protein
MARPMTTAIPRSGTDLQAGEEGIDPQITSHEIKIRAVARR